MFRQNAITFHFSFYSETKHSYTNHTSEMEKPICCVIFIYISPQRVQCVRVLEQLRQG